MPYTQETLIFKKLYELIKLIYNYVKLFPKHEKFILGQRIENTSIDILEGIIKANKKDNKTKELENTSTKLDMLKVYIRLSKELQFMDLKRYEALSSHILEIGKMLGGWIKYEKNRLNQQKILPTR